VATTAAAGCTHGGGVTGGGEGAALGDGVGVGVGDGEGCAAVPRVQAVSTQAVASARARDLAVGLSWGPRR
jgi:hypothetical protein